MGVSRFLGYERFKITGFNQDLLFERLIKNGVILYEVKRVSVKESFFTIKVEDRKKLFAITDKMCYNIKTVKVFGLKNFFSSVKTWIVPFIGIIAFTVISYTFSNVYVESEFYGTGAVYSERVKNYLENEGLSPFTFYSQEKLKKLETKLLKDCDYLSFVALKKKGTHLEATLVKKSSAKIKKVEHKTDLLSSKSGTVKSITVYRGFANKKVGDSVSVGEVLVKSQGQIKDNTVDNGVIAFVEIITAVERSYEIDCNGSEDVIKDLAVILFKEETKIENAEYSVVKNTNGGQNVFTVRAEYVTAIT